MNITITIIFTKRIALQQQRNLRLQKNYNKLILTQISQGKNIRLQQKIQTFVVICKPYVNYKRKVNNLNYDIKFVIFIIILRAIFINLKKIYRLIQYVYIKISKNIYYYNQYGQIILQKNTRKCDESQQNNSKNLNQQLQQYDKSQQQRKILFYVFSSVCAALKFLVVIKIKLQHSLLLTQHNSNLQSYQEVESFWRCKYTFILLSLQYPTKFVCQKLRSRDYAKYMYFSQLPQRLHKSNYYPQRPCKTFQM
eukprot:TRINITY_DN2546_c0_g1_i3.p1 TRINITY_DN2546_c0_g1~~TRINITY_DN2546_c0_g1_i3.p1  ORF type:complete len:252 (+),score=-14.50 TRINITY_DN2546_c0_g1_i3:257-1012(+)